MEIGMCTAVSLNFSHHFFARTLDLDTSYGEAVISTPRKYSFKYRYEKPQGEHYAILGAGAVFDNTPLYYDAFNEAGLAVAALNFPGEAFYFKKRQGALNVASFELISFILSQCATLSEAVELLNRVNITDDSFSDDLPSTTLHWIVADKFGAVAVESVADGLKIYENQLGVLTNSPPFPYHKTRVCDFMGLDSGAPKNEICESVKLPYYSGGLGAMGLPGDFSSSSRFVRGVFLKNHTVSSGGVSQAFHIMDNLAVPEGAVIKRNGKCFFTVYTSVADTDERVYYFTTADSRRIRAVKMTEEDISSDTLSVFSMREEEKIFYIKDALKG